MALFNTLIGPLNSLPWVINGLVEAAVSVGRLQLYLAAPQAAPRVILHTSSGWLQSMTSRPAPGISRRAPAAAAIATSTQRHCTVTSFRGPGSGRAAEECALLFSGRADWWRGT